MLDKLVKKRKTICIVLISLALIMYLLFLIFGKGERKTDFLITSPIVGLLLYAVIPFMFKIVGINASAKAMKFFIWCTLTVGALWLLLDLIAFIRSFPNGFNPSVGCTVGLLLAVLKAARKYVGNPNKQ